MTTTLLQIIADHHEAKPRPRLRMSAAETTDGRKIIIYAVKGGIQVEIAGDPAHCLSFTYLDICKAALIAEPGVMPRLDAVTMTDEAADQDMTRLERAVGLAQQIVHDMSSRHAEPPPPVVDPPGVSAHAARALLRDYGLEPAEIDRAVSLVTLSSLTTEQAREAAQIILKRRPLVGDRLASWARRIDQ